MVQAVYGQTLVSTIQLCQDFRPGCLPFSSNHSLFERAGDNVDSERFSQYCNFSHFHLQYFARFSFPTFSEHENNARMLYCIVLKLNQKGMFNYVREIEVQNQND